MEQKARTIVLKKSPFQKQELLQQTLLHVYFEDRWNNDFKWTPKWAEVEKILFKALEVEENNDPEGAWNDELIKASEQVSSLKEYRLPVKVVCSGLSEVESEKWQYEIQISILPDSGVVGIKDMQGSRFYIDNCYFLMKNLGEKAFKGRIRYRMGIGKTCKEINASPYPDRWIPGGIFFNVFLPKNLTRLEYQTLSRQIGATIRTYVRSIILDSKSIDKGFSQE